MCASCRLIIGPDGKIIEPEYDFGPRFECVEVTGGDEGIMERFQSQFRELFSQEMADGQRTDKK